MVSSEKYPADKRECTGCGACAQKCHCDAIEIALDKNGFYKREIDSEKCIKCGNCSSVCPIACMPQKSEIKQIYWAYNKKLAEREMGSSGGIVYVLGKEIISRGGAVAGVIWADGFRSVKHYVTDKEEELQLFCQSKYLQSRIGNTFLEIESILNGGKPVLFTGTSCQVAGLLKFLDKDYDNLYTLDSVCRGVNSVKAWRAYWEWKMTQLKGDAVIDFGMRSKQTGDRRKSYRFAFCDGHSESFYADDEPFHAGFQRNYTISETCFNCSFKGKERVADITVGDAWGSEILYRSEFDNRGYSNVMLSSDKAIELWKAVNDKCYSKGIPFENVIFRSRNLIQSVDKPKDSDAFWGKFHSESYEKLIDEFLYPISRTLATPEDCFSYKKDKASEKPYKCAYGLGETFRELTRLGTLKVDYCSDSCSLGDVVEGVKFLEKTELLNRKDIFVYITAYNYNAAKQIHEMLADNDIPHKMFFDGE